MSYPIIAAVAAASLLAAAPPAFGQASPASAPAAAGQPIPRARYIASMDGEFRKMDADKNGQLTRTEIEQYQKLRAAAQAKARNRALFTQLDGDKNGQLSPAEFAKIATPAPAADAQPLLARMDSNRDSQISLIEHRTATLANFDRLDTDKDGVVSAAEMKAGGVSIR